MPALSIISDDKKYMWDGEEYADNAAAQARAAQYARDKFEVKVIPANGKHLVYTRRAAEAAGGATCR